MLSLLKFSAFILALKPSKPRYTASAPQFIAWLKLSISPAGAKSSGFGKVLLKFSIRIYNTIKCQKKQASFLLNTKATKKVA
jgi:hypothetical protein